MEEDKVYYDDNGEMWVIDPDTQKMTTFEVDGDVSLKYSNGQYKPGVKANCRQLFFRGVPPPEIAKVTGVAIRTLRNWIAGNAVDNSDPDCWNNQRQKWALEMAEQNKDTVTLLDSHILGKLLSYFNKAKAPDDEKAALLFAEIRSKLMKGDSSAMSGQKGTQVNIQNIVNPMSDQEALRIERADPISRKPKTKSSDST